MTSQPPYTICFEGSCYHHQCKFNVILKLNLYFFENVAEKVRRRIKEEFRWVQIFVIISVDSLQGSTLPKVRIISKNTSNKICWASHFFQKSHRRLCLSAHWVELGVPKIRTFEVLYCTKMEKYLIHINLWSFLVPLLEETNICVHWLFCRKFNARQLLFEAFSDIIGNFGHLEP